MGILNGIDTEIWDPSCDPYLLFHYNKATMVEGKRKNKEEVCKEFGMDPSLPLFSFIGRLVGEKAADLLPVAIQDALLHNPGRANYIVLGSGQKEIEYQLQELRNIAGVFIIVPLGTRRRSVIAYMRLLIFINAQPGGAMRIKSTLCITIWNNAVGAQGGRVNRYGD